MKTVVRATYSNGKLTPEFALDLEEGASLLVSVEVEPRDSRAERGLKALKAATTRMS